MTGPAPEARLANVSGAVLLGGASSRMGSDKAAAEVAGVAAATRVARCLAALCEEVLLVGGTPPDGAPGRAVADVEGPRCALRGLVSALEAASSDQVLAVACDLPLVTPDLLLALVAWPPADAVVPRSDAGAHPLCALYARDAVLPVARRRLAAGELKLQALLDAVDTGFVDAHDLALVDPEGHALTNVNTPDELARARAIADRARA